MLIVSVQLCIAVQDCPLLAVQVCPLVAVQVCPLLMVQVCPLLVVQVCLLLQVVVSHLINLLLQVSRGIWLAWLILFVFLELKHASEKIFKKSIFLFANVFCSV